MAAEVVWPGDIYKSGKAPQTNNRNTTNELRLLCDHNIEAFRQSAVS